MPFTKSRVLSVLVFFVFAASVPSFGVRKPDTGSSQNGATSSIPNCPTDSRAPDATPNFLILDGTSTCGALFTSRVVTLTDASGTFMVTITPALWDNGFGSPGATILNVQLTNLTGQPLSLQSLVIGALLNNPAYVVCDSVVGIGNLSTTAFCTPAGLDGTEVLQPTPIAAADLTTTRWDFSQLTAPAEGKSATLSLVVSGFPPEFVPSYTDPNNINIHPDPNTLVFAPNSSPTPFLAMASNGNHAGTLQLKAAPAAGLVDLIANAREITSTTFTDFIDTSATGSLEILSGLGAGAETVSQGDPIPQGSDCQNTWEIRNRPFVFRSVWYTFALSDTSDVTISTDGSRYDTGVYVYPVGSSTTPTACNDDGPQITLGGQSLSVRSSDITFTAGAGSYYVMVSEAPPDLGFDQNFNPVAGPLANDATLYFKFTATNVIGPPSNPVPFIDIVSPPSSALGSTGTTLKISGSGFVQGATVDFNGTSLTPTTITSSQIEVDNVTAPSGVVTIPLTVVNPNNSPSVGTSNVVPFPVSKQTTSLSLGSKNYSTNGGGVSPIAGDFNEDGKLDIVSAGVGGNQIAVLLGNGNGTFQAQQVFPTGTQPDAVAQGDFNGDGHLDLAVANKADGTVSVLLGNGDGTFQTGVPYTVGLGPDAVVAGDFNGDGKLDLVVANNASNTASLLLGNGDGTFQAQVVLPAAGTAPTSIAEGDLNGDGNLDLVIAAQATLTILLGNGDGTFPVVYVYNTPPLVAIVAGDFNGDGKLDIATANGTATAGVSVFLGVGDGTLLARKDYDTPANAMSVTTADLNGDQKLDLMAGTASTSQAFFLGNGDGTFQVAKSYTSGASNGALVLGDLNNDGRLDMVASLSTGTGVSVLLQTPTASLSKNNLTFPTQVVGTTSAAQTVTLSNKGTAELLISSITPSGDFAETNTCGSGIQPGGSCTISVTFTPTAAGTRTGSVTIKDDGGSGTQTISLTGTGTVVQLTPTSLAFGSVKVGTQSAAKKVTLTNKGTTSLSITSITITGTNAPDFLKTASTCGSTVVAGGSCTISVAFKPTATGARSASLSISDNGGGSPQTAALSGTGT